MKRILNLLPLLFLLGCNMEKEIDVVLPPHEPQLVVECYLEQGYPFEATVLETSSYFDAPTPPVVPGAEVYITFRNQRVKLVYSPGYNGRTNRYYTHLAVQHKMDGKPGEIYGLEVTDGKGRKVTGFTTILPKVPIQKIEWRFNEKDKALLLTSFQDDAATPNFYRYLTHRDSLEKESPRDLLSNDDLTNGKLTTYGSSYRYEDGDTLIVSLFHIEKQYYDFLQSVDNAQNSNGNPFAQPANIKSSVQGGFGIFTNLAFDRDTVIIKKQD